MSGAAARPDWIAVDWGTTTMRAWAMADDGTVLAAAPHGPGMGALEPDGYEPALLGAVGEWIEARTAPLDVIVCGMAGARQGWREAPYAPVPAALDGLLARAVEVPADDARLRVRIVPGLSLAMDGRRDVMRGEETQLLGLLAHEGLPDALVCLPGTHSKWARLEGGSVAAFETHMTGELFALLSERSILRHSMDDGWGDAAFEGGVRDGADGALAQLFGVRASSLLDAPSPGAGRARLSGLLIGAELAALDGADGTVGSDGTIHIIGAGGLARRYAAALRLVGREAIVHDGADLAVAGLATMRQGDARGTH